MTDTDRIVLGTLEAIENACRRAAGAADPATAIADELADYRRLLMDVLNRMPA